MDIWLPTDSKMHVTVQDGKVFVSDVMVMRPRKGTPGFRRPQLADDLHDLGGRVLDHVERKDKPCGD